jgi:hypothetical protein
LRQLRFLSADQAIHVIWAKFGWETLAQRLPSCVAQVAGVDILGRMVQSIRFDKMPRAAFEKRSGYRVRVRIKVCQNLIERPHIHVAYHHALAQVQIPKGVDM